MIDPEDIECWECDVICPASHFFCIGEMLYAECDTHYVWSPGFESLTKEEYILRWVKQSI